MKISDITSISVSQHGEYSFRYALCWTTEEARYHVWLDALRQLQDATIYKNPPLGVEHRGPGYFSTRHLKASDKANQLVVAHVLSEAVRVDMFGFADLKVQAQRERERAENKERARIRRSKEAGPALYAALKHLHDAALLHESSHGHSVASDVIWDEVAKAIAEADKE